MYFWFDTDLCILRVGNYVGRNIGTMWDLCMEIDVGIGGLVGGVDEMR
jgi:hypothetical protein